MLFLHVELCIPQVLYFFSKYHFLKQNDLIFKQWNSFGLSNTTKLKKYILTKIRNKTTFIHSMGTTRFPKKICKTLIPYNRLIIYTKRIVLTIYKKLRNNLEWPRNKRFIRWNNHLRRSYCGKEVSCRSKLSCRTVFRFE